MFDIGEYKMNCDSIHPDIHPKLILYKKKIFATKFSKTLLLKSIKEIMDLKIKSTCWVGHSGDFSGLSNEDKSLNITIYPSPTWTNFDKLFSQLKKKISR